MKKRLLSLLLVLCCLLLSGCSQLMDNTLALVADKAAESGADTLARQFVDGILADDAEMSLAAMADGVTMESLQQVFPQMREMLPAADDYTLTPTYWNSSTNNGVTQTSVQFRMEIGGQLFQLQTVQVSSMEGLYNIHIAPVTEEAAAESAGQSSPVWELLSILLTIASCAVTLWALIHCVRHKMKRKWLWLLLVILGSVMLTFTLSSGHLNLRFNIGLYLVASQITATSSGFVLKLVVPVGPIIYLCRRKALTAPPKKAFSEAFSDAPEAPTAQAAEDEATPVQEDSHESEEV